MRFLTRLRIAVRLARGRLDANAARDLSDHLDDIHGDYPTGWLRTDLAQEIARQRWVNASVLAPFVQRGVKYEAAHSPGDPLMERYERALRRALEIAAERRITPVSYAAIPEAA